MTVPAVRKHGWHGFFIFGGQVKSWILGMVWVLGLTCACAAEGSRRAGMELLERKVQADPEDFIGWNQLGNYYLGLHLETGAREWLKKLEKAVKSSLKVLEEGLNPGAHALSIRLDLAEHRFAEARDKAKRLYEAQPQKSGAVVLLASALFELGDVDESERVLAAIDGGIEVEMRRAAVAWARGRHEEARKHMTKARDEAVGLDPGQPAVVAWCEVQLGEQAFRTGDWQVAEERYLAALKSMPDWWSALDHLAELRGAQGRNEEAFALYEKVVAKTGRPEVMQAVGDLHLFIGEKEQAKAWHDRALKGYLEAGAEGSVAYLHHLAGFYSDSQVDAAAAVAAARKDRELRHSAASHDALAWALYRQGDGPGALSESELALASGLRDAHVLYHAGMIRMTNGQVARGQAALREAAAVNPRFNAFHAHR